MTDWQKQNITALALKKVKIMGKNCNYRNTEHGATLNLLVYHYTYCKNRIKQGKIISTSSKLEE